jgi:ligand-binding sensor domain-containing protein
LKKLIYIFLILTLNAVTAFAQYPHYFQYDNENGLPSNEMYSIVQDQKGFVWMGCDAGLFKFDGVRYTSYKCKTQNSKSISNLTLSENGKIYCVNFQDQIFFLENDSLKELQHTLHNISNIATVKNGMLYVNHSKGISVFNPKTQDWKNIKGISDFTRSVSVNGKNEIYFLSQKGLIRLNDEQAKLYQFPNNLQKVASEFLLDGHKNVVWIFKRDGSVCYTFKDGQIVKDDSRNLSLALQNRKITNIKSLSDGKLWICTYNGIVCYDTQKDSAQILYPNKAFTDVLIDRENNYWFSNLQNGLIRIPNLNYLVWNTGNPNISNEKLTKLATDGTHIFFSSINGIVWKLNTINYSVQTFHTGKNSDIECLYFDEQDKQLIFHSQNSTYTLKNEKISHSPFQKNAVKSIIHTPPFYFFGSSLGLYVESENYNEKLSETWTRQLAWNDKEKTLYAATNKGLQIFNYKQNKWVCTDTLFANTQIVSIDFAKTAQQFFVLAFDGKVYQNNEAVAQLPENVQGNKLNYFDNKIYIASNKGVWIFDLTKKQWNSLNALSGLASENVNDLIILNGNLWLATGKGLQKIPLNRQQEKPLAKIYLKNSGTTFKINYNEMIVLNPEASIYSANGKFEYAYRINQSEWIKLPATIEQIEIHNLPIGTVEIELKAVDHLGRDSENTIVLSGVVKPPFYKTWWFILIVVFILFGLAYFFYKRQLNKQRKEFKRQNELNIAKLTAIRSQMNPHFIFNSLNSIQDLILQKKTVESYDYVVLFSELVRNTLNYSNKEFISIREEIEFLEIYLQLEQLRFKNDLHYQILYNGTDEIDVPSLMIQPFVENALFHGLLHKGGKKELTVRFTFDEELLICTIEDNGIGRKQADNIRTRQGQKHNSFALEAIQKRMDIFNERQGKIIGQFLFEDINPNEKDTGTRVVIRLPFKRKY